MKAISSPALSMALGCLLFGCRDYAELPATASPSADFYWQIGDCQLGSQLAVNFTAIQDLETESFEWNFGDGTPPETGQTINHPFSNSGQKTVTLTALSVGDTSKKITHTFFLDDPAQPVTWQFDSIQFWNSHLLFIGEATHVVECPDGKILVTGRASANVVGQENKMFVLKLDGRGRIDVQFKPFFYPEDDATAVGITSICQPDGSVLAFGNIKISGQGEKMAFIRLDRFGKPTVKIYPQTGKASVVDARFAADGQRVIVLQKVEGGGIGYELAHYDSQLNGLLQTTSLSGGYFSMGRFDVFDADQPGGGKLAISGVSLFPLMPWLGGFGEAGGLPFFEKADSSSTFMQSINAVSTAPGGGFWLGGKTGGAVGYLSFWDKNGQPKALANLTQAQAQGVFDVLSVDGNACLFAGQSGGNARFVYGKFYDNGTPVWGPFLEPSTTNNDRATSASATRCGGGYLFGGSRSSRVFVVKTDKNGIHQ